MSARPLLSQARFAAKSHLLRRTSRPRPPVASLLAPLSPPSPAATPFRLLSSVPAIDPLPSSPLRRKKKRRPRRPRRAPIVVTDVAAARIRALLSDAEGDPLGIRLGVKRRGCNGLSYTLNYAYEVPPQDEDVVTPNGVRVFVEPAALFSIVGTVMDWEEDALTAEFTFKNPNSKGECGCGESFTV
uniref:Core domain-containing protein n=1 Tax=Corethron hystrix TaxID=216773 RepID=A0A7S1BZJ0_9STRA|mmetsp:Transcript_8118/g.17632  ORF Transcript_8118/g.17632 Transcript_8118/m.17632 type:complete len:186 (+) Transcript_8118:111-668(+)